MPPAPDNSGKISTFSRVLAWILLLLTLAVITSWLFDAIRSGRTSNLGLPLPMLLLMAGGAVFFGFAAIKGRSPRWMTSMETLYGREATRRGISTKGESAGRAISYITCLLVFGLMLFLFGRKLGIFEGETGWFGAAVFFAAWLIVALILRHSYRRRAPSPTAGK